MSGECTTCGEHALECKCKKTKVSAANKNDILTIIDGMIENIENLPQHAMMMPITHYDYYSLLVLMSSLFRTED